MIVLKHAPTMCFQSLLIKYLGYHSTPNWGKKIFFIPHEFYQINTVDILSNLIPKV